MEASEQRVLYYRCSGSGPSAVLIHGVAGSQMVWDPVVPLLAGALTVVRMDLIGYGRSPAPSEPCTPGAHIAAVRHTLHEAGLVPPYNLVGLSMGANIALAYGAAWPHEVNKIVGLGFPYFPTMDAARSGMRANPWTRLTLTRPRVARATLPTLWKLIRRSGVMRFHRGIYTPTMANDALRVDFDAFASSMRSCMLEFPYDDVLSHSATLPRLFIHGSEDRWATAQTVGRVLTPFPGTDLLVLDGAPHNVVVTEPERTAAAVLAFLVGETASPSVRDSGRDSLDGQQRPLAR